MLLSFLLLWLSYWPVSPQQSLPDSLIIVSQTTDNDSIKSAAFVGLSIHYYAFDQDTAIFYGKQALEIARDNNFRKLESNALNIIGVSYLIKSDYEEALKAHLGALRIRESLKDTVGIVESNLNLGNIYYRSNEINRAAEMYRTSLHFAELVDHKRAMGLLYNNLGSYHRDLWLKGEDTLQNFNFAMDYLQKSFEIKESQGAFREMVNTLSQLSELYLGSGDKEKSIEKLNRALELTEKYNDLESKISVLDNLANNYRYLGSLDSAMKFALKAHALAKESKSAYQLASSANLVSRVAAEQRDFKTAYEYLALAKSSDDDLFNETRQKIRDELTIQYESEKKELENERLLKEQEFSDLKLRRNKELLVLTVLAVVFMGVLLYIQRRNNLKLRIANDELTEAHDLVQDQHQQIQVQRNNLDETNRQLIKANRFRDKIFSVISHDLRTPFSSINNIIELWNSGDMSPGEMNEIMLLISRDTNAASLMLENLLAWARSQMGSNEIQLKDFMLYPLVQENKDLFDLQLKRKNQKLSNLIPSDLILYSDRERLNFIIRNLLMNAIKFTHEGGEISVEYSKEVTGVIFIKDNGVGIAGEKIAMLFENRNLSTRGTDGESGTGIGLMLCKEFAESIGATISIESEVNKGTVFSIMLPAGSS